MCLVQENLCSPGSYGKSSPRSIILIGVGGDGNGEHKLLEEIVGNFLSMKGVKFESTSNLKEGVFFLCFRAEA